MSTPNWQRYPIWPATPGAPIPVRIPAQGGVRLVGSKPAGAAGGPTSSCTSAVSATARYSVVSIMYTVRGYSRFAHIDCLITADPPSMSGWRRSTRALTVLRCFRTLTLFPVVRSRERRWPVGLLPREQTGQILPNALSPFVTSPYRRPFAV